MKTMEIGKGLSIYDACEHACIHARNSGSEVRFEFNGIDMFAHPLSHAADIAVIYSLKSALRSATS